MKRQVVTVNGRITSVSAIRAAADRLSKIADALEIPGANVSGTVGFPDGDFDGTEITITGYVRDVAVREVGNGGAFAVESNSDRNGTAEDLVREDLSPHPRIGVGPFANRPARGERDGEIWRATDRHGTKERETRWEEWRGTNGEWVYAWWQIDRIAELEKREKELSALVVAAETSLAKLRQHMQQALEDQL